MSRATETLVRDGRRGFTVDLEAIEEMSRPLSE